MVILLIIILIVSVVLASELRALRKDINAVIKNQEMIAGELDTTLEKLEDINIKK